MESALRSTSQTVFKLTIIRRAAMIWRGYRYENIMTPREFNSRGTLTSMGKTTTWVLLNVKPNVKNLYRQTCIIRRTLVGNKIVITQM